MNRLSISIVFYDTSIEIAAKTLSDLGIAVSHAQRKNLIGQTSVVIVNNSQEERVVNQLIIKHANNDFSLRVLQNTNNIGFGAAHNQSILTQRSHYHLVLNPDAFLHKEALSVAIDFLEKHPDIAMITPMGMNTNNQPVYLAKRFPSLLILALRGLSLTIGRRWFGERLSGYEYHDIGTEGHTEVLLASGCCMLCRTDILQSVKGFDERFFLYFEDFDLSLRIKQLGKIACLPAMVVVHSGGNAARKGFRHILMFSMSMLRFFNRWGWRFL
jgi:GT2 family glycosyltransferase